MLTSKQRAYLRSLANELSPIMQVGKGGISENLVKTVSDALEAREIIKMSVLDTADDTPRGTAEALAVATDADVVAVIGKKIVLYRPAQKPVLVLPK